MISLILSCGDNWQRLHTNRHVHTHARPHTHTHTHRANTYLHHTQNGSSNLSLRFALTVYSNCTCDSWQKPWGITKEHPLSTLPLSRISTSTIRIINFLAWLLRWCVRAVRVHLWARPSIHYELISLVSVVFLNSKEAISQVAWALSRAADTPHNTRFFFL